MANSETSHGSHDNYLGKFPRNESVNPNATFKILHEKHDMLWLPKPIQNYHLKEKVVENLAWR